MGDFDVTVEERGLEVVHACDTLSHVTEYL
jgi:hypothetical protein